MKRSQEERERLSGDASAVRNEKNERGDLRKEQEKKMWWAKAVGEIFKDARTAIRLSEGKVGTCRWRWRGRRRRKTFSATHPWTPSQGNRVSSPIHPLRFQSQFARHSLSPSAPLGRTRPDSSSTPFCPSIDWAASLLILADPLLIALSAQPAIPNRVAEEGGEPERYAKKRFEGYSKKILTKKNASLAGVFVKPDRPSLAASLMAAVPSKEKRTEGNMVRTDWLCQTMFPHGSSKMEASNSFSLAMAGL
ncbi:hypothetical protein B0H63DRAFT_101450 [Podospora didyma]|uniref:Uncharacterized protein n=1 Tax=Podospora didyma TaxID=330526 RepID=A0AAE0NXU1_9PEZI|nr:hypothetical protein B0H63DRAFT_101450 [Podospora didyma]